MAPDSEGNFKLSMLVPELPWLNANSVRSRGDQQLDTAESVNADVAVASGCKCGGDCRCAKPKAPAHHYEHGDLIGDQEW